MLGWKREHQMWNKPHRESRPSSVHVLSKPRAWQPICKDATGDSAGARCRAWHREGAELLQKAGCALWWLLLGVRPRVWLSG